MQDFLAAGLATNQERFFERKETLMKGIPLIETHDPDLITRAYNLGLKIVPNLAHVLTREDLEYWEVNLPELKISLGNSLVRSRDSGVVSPDPRFELLATFKVAVPKDYDHATRLGSFAKEHRAKFRYGYNDNITDANFAKATQRLVPGKTYGAKIWGIQRGAVISSPDCLAFLKTQKAILVGAQGLTLAWEQKKEKFPKRWTISFDEKGALPYLGGNHRVPYVHAHSFGDFELNLGDFENDWLDDYCFLCLCDEE